MKKSVLIIIALIMATLMMTSGCSIQSLVDLEASLRGDTTEQEQDDKETKHQSEDDYEDTTESQEDAEEKQSSEQSSEESSEQSSSVSLSQSELNQFTAWAQDYSNYGFLLSNYTDPSGVDIKELLHGGAGMPNRELTSDEIRTYLAITGESEIITDTVVLSSADIDNYLERKLGISFDSVRSKLDWAYLPQSDIWVAEHGDTNYNPYQCVGGKLLDGNKYVLEFVPIYNFNSYYSPCETTLIKNGGDYRVVSNIFKQSSGMQGTPQNNNEYMISGSDGRYITKNEIQSLSKEDLRIARNEIYARHGRLFTSADLQQYFSTKSWYMGSIPPEQFDESVLNQYEKANLKIIKEVEDTK